MMIPLPAFWPGPGGCNVKRLDSLHQYEVDDSVMYEDDPNDAGIVIKKSESALYIEWDNGQ